MPRRESELKSPPAFRAVKENEVTCFPWGNLFP
jgi:hypothetical protein